MKDLEHALSMLEKAENDLKALKAMENEESFSNEIFGFHAQQAVEKSLKAWLSAAGVKYPRIHDLDELIELMKGNGITIPLKFHELGNLTDFAVIFRYEVIEKYEAPLDRAEIINSVEALYMHVLGIVHH